MLDWGYWRWQAARNLPLFVIIVVTITAVGWTAINAIPPEHTVSSRIILERSLGLGGAPKAQRSAEEVQHLQLILHELGVVGQSPDTPVEFKIESSRDKPTYLSISSTQSSAVAALTAVRAAETAVIEQGEKTRRDGTLSALTNQISRHETSLTQANKALAAHESQPLTGSEQGLERQADQLRARIERGPVEDAAITKLRIDLAVAQSIYSDTHPKLRQLRDRLSRQPEAAGDDWHAQLQSQLDRTLAALTDLRSYQATASRLEGEVTTATSALREAQDALVAAQLAQDANRINLRVVENAALDSADPRKARLAMLLGTLLAAVLAAVAGIWLRVRIDPRVRRPRDMRNALGLTPFATLPDLGPSLG
ncbi:GumC domain-containing protein [Litoreibacter arenae]|uniref:Polysaccharide chain length determinant N-terminal domain-containing protein n=1 Tax=Litoreibacter arenae DSM 19593 TaxID=1123360 RepID=S9RHG2_9RHOB|nr:hypothetical protein [Litoreibacter arenae]EPX77525.1 hypothetical protein thalar_03249 [Litoreibacter arenae DSM 19593]